MNGVTMVCVLLFVQHRIIKTSQDESRAVKVFYCKISGCAANVTNVFCKDEPVPVHPPFPNCSGTPLNNTVCQHDGRAFISYDGNGNCEFEGELPVIGYIDTAKCPVTGNLCGFMTGSAVFLACLFLGMCL